MHLTLSEFLKMIYSPDNKPIYFYDCEPDFDEHGNDVFNDEDLFLIYNSPKRPENMLSPEVCDKTVRQIYFCENRIIRVVLDDDA